MDLQIIKEALKQISIRGRVYYALECLIASLDYLNLDVKKYLLTIENIAEFTESNNLSEWEKKAVEISPDTILDTHKDNDFDNYETLNVGEANTLKQLYEQTPKLILEIIDFTISIGINNLYGGTGKYSEETLKPLCKIIDMLIQNGIQIPKVSKFEFSNFKEFNGWGKPFKIPINV